MGSGGPRRISIDIPLTDPANPAPLDDFIDAKS
jgi:hypothetical protein